ncbi:MULTISPECIES: hypothetical protein [Bacillus]|uniref:hypothetical protein n=1 Tax=Bacillus TaxID=1386 RepID=UPI00138A5ED7|nr:MULTISPECIES: hypothetical protein [Bacillus]MBT2168760.1 hypothetical protein [Bacillus subtilis]MCZ8480923.1 hypothetical protein [Bacillus subtilis]MDD9763954.1 hypothetical protein [Bacillus subtilis]MDD9768384.1 hypothetical protein [Bacillus subtilis]MDD9787544.1 hypothetical protein [Bacillus subtilis]
MSVSVKSVKAKDLAVIDPHEASLENWRRYTSRILMRYLRSPSVQQRKWSNCFMQAAVFRMSARAGICGGEKD